MSESVEYMVSWIRNKSGLRNNPLWSDQDIIDAMNDASAKLRDVFIASFAHWFRKTYRFTLAGGVGGNTLDLTEIPDLQMDQYLNRNPDLPNPEPVTRLGSLAERAQFGALPAGFNRGRRYDTDGDVLTIYPASNSAGDYELVYTSMGEKLKPRDSYEFDIPTAPGVQAERSITIVGGSDNCQNGSRIWTFANGRFIDAGTQPGNILDVTSFLNSGPHIIEEVISQTQVKTFDDPLTETFLISDSAGIDDVLQFSFPGAAFTEDMIGGEITLDFTATVGPPDNSQYNGTFTIFDVLASNTLQIPVYLPSATIDLPAGGTLSVSWQEPGTRDDLPQVLTPWALYLKLYVCILIRQSRDRPTDDLTRLFKPEELRLEKMSKTRTEGVKQAPMTRNRHRRGGFNYGSQ